MDETNCEKIQTNIELNEKQLNNDEMMKTEKERPKEKEELNQIINKIENEKNDLNNEIKEPKKQITNIEEQKIKEEVNKKE